ncbi:GDP-L-fucose synthase, partial [Alphaproteobacteria bacterium]|nr:GDP-L-fucose synthase [Alphaproteobacteria bacterium]
NDEQPINIGTGQEVSIQQLAEMLKDVSGWQGNLVFDSTKPDGSPRKVMQSDRIHALGWQHKTELRNGLEKAFLWFDENQRAARL